MKPYPGAAKAAPFRSEAFAEDLEDLDADPRHNPLPWDLVSLALALALTASAGGVTAFLPV